jgi:hypothetical protein
LIVRVRQAHSERGDNVVAMRRVLAALAVSGLTACTDILPPDDGGNGSFTVTVGSGTTPSYSWTGGAAFRVEVAPVANPFIPVWAVADPNNRNIASPVRHGTVPSGAVLLADEEPVLRAGVNYRVTVTLPNNERSSRDFRP